MISKNWVFFDDTSTSATSNEVALSPHDGAITIQVDNLGSGSYSVKFQGQADFKDTKWHDIKLVKLSTFNTMGSITEDGLYLCPVAGDYKVRAVLGSDAQAGTVKVYGNILS